MNLLPSFWANLSLANPILYMVNGFRYGMLGVSDINIWQSYGKLVVFVVLGFSVSLYLMAKAEKLRT